MLHHSPGAKEVPGHSPLNTYLGYGASQVQKKKKHIKYRKKHIKYRKEIEKEC